MGFIITKSENSLFTFRRGSDTAYLLLYVDYILLVTSSDDMRERLIAQLKTEFSMYDLGPLSYLLLSPGDHLICYYPSIKMHKKF